MNKIKLLNKKKAQRIRRVRAVIKGTAARPRLVVRRTNQHFYAQIIDDAAGRTLLSVSNLASKKNPGTSAKMKKADSAFAAGELLGKKAVEKGIAKVVFDRRSYQFHGRVKRFAEGVQKGGLTI